jgi:hypothetical protein
MCVFLTLPRNEFTCHNNFMPNFSSCVLVPPILLVSHMVTQSSNCTHLYSQWTTSNISIAGGQNVTRFQKTQFLFLELQLTPNPYDKDTGMCLTSVRWSWLQYGLKCTATGWADLYSRQQFHVFRVTGNFACQFQTRKGSSWQPLPEDISIWISYKASSGLRTTR